MPNKKNRNVNLDALIQREDFEASDDNNTSTSKVSSIAIREMKMDSGFFLPSIRKPDFQRETADWDAEKVTHFIQSFVNGEFIPSVILWRSQAGLIFVIDGSHRLSSLIAWANDDYGDKEFSLEVYEGEIPNEQKQIAKEAREKINKEIGQYNDYISAISSKHPDPDFLVKARNLATIALPIQWIDGDVETAEKSFFNINQQAAPIDPTEMKLLQKRKHANCIASRSIIKAGKGHKYWHKFSPDIQKEIEGLAKSVHKLLFEPAIQRPIKTLDIPLCDRSTNALTLIVDSIASINGENDSIDIDGSATVSCLRKIEKVIRLINSSHPGSYGLHPILFCYSNRGNFRPASFYAMLEFVKKLNNNSKTLRDFIKNRGEFESIIFNNDYIVQRIIDSHRRGTQSAKHISEYYCEVFKLLSEGTAPEDAITQLSKNEKYRKYISDTNDASFSSADFSRSHKSEVFIRQAFSSAPRCAICGGLLHSQSISIDHILRKQDGGLGNPENGQLTHPYCNTGIKN